MTRTIQIVEDSRTQAMRLAAVLEQAGYRVRVAINGADGLAAVAGDRPHLVISDIVMPEMDGYNMCRQLKENPDTRDVPVVLLSTLSDPMDVIRGLECGADSFMLKPYEERYLLAQVDNLLTSRDLRRGNANRIRMSLEFSFLGKQFSVTSEREQILDLLLSVFEQAVRINDDLRGREAQLARTNATLAAREAELGEAKSFLEDLLAASPSMVFRCDPSTFRILYASPNVGWLLGYGVDEVVGAENFWEDRIHPEDRERAVADLRSAIDARCVQVEQEYRVRGKDDRYRWFFVLARIDYTAGGEPLTLLRYCLDIGDRKTAEHGLRASEQRLQAVVDHSPAFITLKDPDGRFVLVNREFERAFGIDRTRAVGRSDADLFAPDLAATYRAHDAEALAAGRAIHAEEPAPDGDAVYAVSKFPLLDVDGRPYAIGGIGLDITEKKRADDEVRAARLEAERANSAKSEFLSRMSHELRTPLNAVLGFAQLLADEELQAEDHECVQQILKGGKHLLDLINEVLDIARIEAGRLSLSPEPVAVREITRHATDLIEPLARARDITLQIEEPFDSERFFVLADRQRLNQILLNLLSNAVKYNRKGGGVTVRFVQQADRIRITVTDTGAGLSQQKLQLLFTPFERLDAASTPVEGTGLGLALSRGLAEAMGGSIGVESEVDRGSTFWVDLAAAEAPSRSGVEAPAPTPLPIGGRAATVLYIEDNTSNVRLMDRVLRRRSNVTLLHAPDGAAGIAMAYECRPHVVFLDLHLPDLSGEEVLRQLRDDPTVRGIPVVTLTADATPGQMRRLIALGADAYLTKPLDLRQVLEVLEEMILLGEVRVPQP